MNEIAVAKHKNPREETRDKILQFNVSSRFASSLGTININPEHCNITIGKGIFYIHQYMAQKKIITQLTHREINSFTSISHLFYKPTEC